MYMRHFLKKKHLKKVTHKRGLELAGFMYAEWCMNKNIQRADFTQYENSLLQVGCHYSPGAKKTTLKNAQIAKVACSEHRSLEILCKMCELL